MARVLRCALLLIGAVAGLPYDNVTHPLQTPRTSLGPAVAAVPFPTGAFWTNFVLGNEAVASLPYSVKVVDSSLQISYPFRVVTSTNIIEGFTAEIVVDVGAGPAVIERFDELSVTVAFQSGAILLHLARGSPFITLEYRGATPALSSALEMLSLKPDAANNCSELLLGNWHKWLLFTSAPLAWTPSGKTFKGPANYSGIVRFGLELHSVFRPLLARHATTYPVGAVVSHAMTGANRVTWSFSWTTKSFSSGPPTAPLLMTALLHHLDTFTPEMQLLDEIKYMAIRGPMTGVVGNTWTFADTLDEPAWDYPTQGIMATPESAEYAAAVAAIKAALPRDSAMYPTFTADAYNFGKQIAREARLVLIADRLNASDVVALGIAKMKRELAKWWDASQPNHFVYDTTYGGLVTVQGLADRDAEFGSGYYNDHHFHYGYFVYAAAVLRRFDPAFVRAHAAALDMIVGDIASPAGAALFPAARHKDWFCGHSYASGLFSMSNGKSQESSSEAVNAYYAVALYASLDEDRAFYDYARLLLAMDVRSTQRYWHMSELQLPAIYEPAFAANRMVGVVSEMSVVYSTWFGNLAAEIHGINLMPITPMTTRLVRPEYAWQQQAVLDASRDAGPDFWPTLSLLDKAIVNASDVWSRLASGHATYDSGNSAANALLFVASQPPFAPNTTAPAPAPQCFGFSACFVAGAFGAPLECCNTLPGCCPSDNACCTAALAPVADDACHGEPACGALGLGCCDSPAGCCDPAGVVLGCCKPKTAASTDTCRGQPQCGALGLSCCASPAGCCEPTASGQVLGCCIAETPVPSINSSALLDRRATCYNEPKCLKAGLDCCGSDAGCCAPNSAGGYHDCCTAFATAPTALPQTQATCHNEPKCLALGVECCDSEAGCCSGSPLLDCCKAFGATDIKVGDGVGGTCGGNPRCLTAGPNATPLWCCLDPTGPGCCPGADCCDAPGVSAEKVIAIAVAVVFGLCVIYCVSLLYRRRHYEPIERDARSWYCAGFMLVIATFFVYLMLTDMHFNVPVDV
ncbi:endo-1,3(4)-beta-glucanase [Achlya hypogyna]|uniref:glucan endo-1,3-beta-D-glucosidase n=1 Tax=Achlya hypogyna TaxID=1202772 RepID=A0A1V9YFL8_ACHHY|nr:endo-1,3(4)-beta-glucanase [Achlya hypogyna]